MIEFNQPYTPTVQQLEGLSFEATLGSFLSSMREHCGDIENFLICIAVAARNYGSADRELSGRVPMAAAKLRASNILSVSAATGIPRETVRRKTLKLCDLGLLERAGRKLFVTGKFFSMAQAERQRVQAKLKAGPRLGSADHLKTA